MKKYKISFLIVQDYPIGIVNIKAESKKEAIQKAQEGVNSGDLDFEIEPGSDDCGTIHKYDDFMAEEIDNKDLDRDTLLNELTEGMNESYKLRLEVRTWLEEHDFSVNENLNNLDNDDLESLIDTCKEFPKNSEDYNYVM